MDARFLNLGFSAHPASKNLGNSIQVQGARADHCADATLQLDSPCVSLPFFSASNGIKRKWSSADESTVQQVGSSLCRGFCHSSNTSGSKGNTSVACTKISDKETDVEPSTNLHLGNEKILGPKKSVCFHLNELDVHPKVDLKLSLSTGSVESDITTVHSSSTSFQNIVTTSMTIGGVSPIDEISASSCWNIRNSFHASRTSNKGTSCFLNHALGESNLAPIGPDTPAGIIKKLKTSVASTSGITQQLQCTGNAKTCQFKGCIKGARGASGLCIAHGGGRRCHRPGCHKGAEGRTAFCKAHGGGRRCDYLGCTRSAEGRTDFCIAHGGGHRCGHEGCTRAARGKSGLCIRHGGGKRCRKENCLRSAEGLSGLCISHGGGRRCQYPACTKGAQGSTMFCKAHGGGKRCTYDGCTKGAEGSTSFCKGHGGGKRCSFHGGGVCPKSVHGGTLFCVAHGGGKRCIVPECTKSARGRTDFCVRHGGGKRCKTEGCEKSAQGSTDFCKAHGGGKKCSWGQPGSECGKGDVPCTSFARGKAGLCTSHGALVQEKRVPVVIATCGGTHAGRNIGVQQVSLPVTGKVLEGRVHGGSIMAILLGSSSIGLNGHHNIVGGLSDPGGSSSMMPHHWM